MHAFSSPQDTVGFLHPARAATADFSGRSNLALAFLCLPRGKRADMNVFYTFCRVVDDIADSPDLPPEEKAVLLEAWRALLRSTESSPTAQKQTDATPLLADELCALVVRYRIPPGYLLDIITGVEMDLVARTYTTFEQLKAYCYKVASVVGLVSIEIFGYQDEETRKYAVELGFALQLTNIIRDVAVDLDNGGRIYLPLEDLERFGYTAADLRARVYDKRFQALMAYEAERAGGILSQCHGAFVPGGPAFAGRGGDHARHLLAAAARHPAGPLPGLRAPLPPEHASQDGGDARRGDAQPLGAIDQGPTSTSGIVVPG